MCRAAHPASIRQMKRRVSCGSADDYQADQQAGVARLISRVSGRIAGRCRAAPVASIRQMSRQVSPGSGGEYQADERAGVAGLRNLLTNSALDPIGKIPEAKYCAVSVTAGGTPAPTPGYPVERALAAD